VVAGLAKEVVTFCWYVRSTFIMTMISRDEDKSAPTRVEEVRLDLEAGKISSKESEDDKKV